MEARFTVNMIRYGAEMALLPIYGTREAWRTGRGRGRGEGGQAKGGHSVQGAREGGRGRPQGQGVGGREATSVSTSNLLVVGHKKGNKF